jgi:predicted O-linked N-acetylglucosamine transferase (SPINDLY family)
MEKKMNIVKLFTVISLSTTLLLSATPESKKDLQMKEIVKLGNQGSQLLLKTLGKNMKQHMKKGGVMDALNFCSNEAYSLTEKVNKKLPKGVTVKRVSAKYRSPANAPQDHELAILDSFEKLQKLNVVLPKYVVEKVDNKTFKYYKPLVINNKVCLKCHGVLKDIDLKRAIAERYPLDKALEYKMNDLRGAVVVTIKTK